MKRLIFSAVLLVVFIAGGLWVTHVQAVGDIGVSRGDRAAQEEAEGKEVWEKLESKKQACKDLSDEDLELLGEYSMGLMIGDSHSAMNEMIARIHGEEGEKQIHGALGKRLSGCDPNATIPGRGQSWMSMMNVAWGGWSVPFTNQINHMMYGFNSGMGWGLGIFGWLFMVVWWGFIIAGIIALIKWFLRSSHGEGVCGRSSLDILKQRYAKGEIDKKEFEEKRRDLQ